MSYEQGCCGQRREHSLVVVDESAAVAQWAGQAMLLRLESGLRKLGITACP